MRVGDTIRGRYRLEAPLGTGGMAEVWRATDEHLSRPVAIKFLDARLLEQPEFMVRFFAEAQSVAAINHPNVVSVFDFGATDAGSYLVTEYVAGGALSLLVGEPMLPERALDIIQQAARGAGAAHAIGLVHRDVKPPNILLTEDERPKLADFGIAAARGGERLTGTGQALGSPHYISPEQVVGDSAVPASDVYALGVVLYELLAGAKPFEAESVTALAIQHVEREPEPPSVHAPGLDPDIDALVMRCLEKDPERRFEDGNALADAIESRRRDQPLAGPLQSVDDHEGEHEYPDEYGDDYEEAWAPARRRRGPLLAAAVIAATMAVGAAVFLLGGPEREPAAPDAPGGRVAAPVENRKDGKGDRKEKASSAPAVSVTPRAAPSLVSAPATGRTQSAGNRDPRGRRPSGSKANPAPEPQARSSPRPEPTPGATSQPTVAPTPAPSPAPSPPAPSPVPSSPAP